MRELEENAKADIPKIVESLSIELMKLNSRYDVLQFLKTKARRLVKPSQGYLVDDYRIPGCIVNIWMWHHYEGQSLKILGYSESQFACGVIALLIEIFDDRSIKDAQSLDFAIFSAPPWQAIFSVSHKNGLRGLLDWIYRIIHTGDEGRGYQ